MSKKIYCETIETSGFEAAFLGMRAPLKSYQKHDSGYALNYETNRFEYIVGKNDMDLAKRLCRSGREHRKFLRFLHVQAKIAMPRYWWSEYDTYKIGTAANSESTMHKLLNSNEPITEEQFYFGKDLSVALEVEDSIGDTIEKLEDLRQKYKGLKGTHFTKSELLAIAKRILPESFIQTRFVDLSYETVLNICEQRKNHRLKEEWVNTFVAWAKTLPCHELIFLEEYE